MSFLYVLEINPISCIICKYFLPMCSLSFHFFYDFLYCAQVFEFDWALLVYFCFCFIYFGDREKNCCNLWQRVFCLYFPPRIL